MELPMTGSWGFGWMDCQLIVALVLAILVVSEQMSYKVKGRKIPGPSMVMPFLGDALRLAKNPAQFWRDQATMSGTIGFCWNVLLGKFVLFVRDPQLSQKVFGNIRPDAFRVVAHPFGEKLVGEGNLVPMMGEEHRHLRRRLAPNFTPKALGLYISLQEKAIREHISTWLEFSKRSDGEPIRLRNLIRDLNLETSQDTFLGPYMSEKSRSRFREEFDVFNKGAMCLPIDLPGFAYFNARLARRKLCASIQDCIRRSKLRMAEGKESACFADFWMAEMIKDIATADASGESFPPHSKDSEVASHVFAFLFASQDAATSALTWALVLLEQHPTVLARVREEQQRVRPDLLAPISPEQVQQMEYTAMVVKEILRYRPPAPMLPHVAMADFQLTDTYKVPKGTIVFPSISEAAVQGFTDPEQFDPERFSPQRQEDVVHRINWMVFGAGPHHCPGQRYAVNHLTLFVALFSTLVDWTRVRTPGCDDFVYLPTVSPKDDALLRISSRVQASS